MNKYQKFNNLRENFINRLKQPEILIAPGVHDMVSLRLADTFGFDALYMTGYGTVASALGLPDAGLATFSEMLEKVTMMADMANTPLIADGDTGYGGLLNIRHTIRGYENAGVSGYSIRGSGISQKMWTYPE
jgi:2-methylisocitrate lyase-like PEP mutase family enzyme